MFLGVIKLTNRTYKKTKVNKLNTHKKEALGDRISTEEFIKDLEKFDAYKYIENLPTIDEITKEHEEAMQNLDKYLESFSIDKTIEDHSKAMRDLDKYLGSFLYDEKLDGFLRLSDKTLKVKP